MLDYGLKPGYYYDTTAQAEAWAYTSVILSPPGIKPHGGDQLQFKGLSPEISVDPTVRAEAWAYKVVALLTTGLQPGGGYPPMGAGFSP